MNESGAANKVDGDRPTCAEAAKCLGQASCLDTEVKGRAYEVQQR